MPPPSPTPPTPPPVQHVQVVEPAKPVYFEPVVAPIEPIKAPPPPPPPAPVYEERPASFAKPIQEQPRPTPSPVWDAPVTNSEIDALFEESAGNNDLSDRISASKIADLTKAFGVNDRLLTINELFAGNGNHFSEAMRELNELGSFAEAKKYLNPLAVRYHWATNEDRKKQAKTFIKLVRRKFVQ
jgi:hypothetical protein